MKASLVFLGTQGKKFVAMTAPALRQPFLIYCQILGLENNLAVY